MLKNYKEVEPNANFIPDCKKLQSKFEYFLNTIKIYSLFKIRPKVAYNFTGRYYHICIEPQLARKSFDSQKYFMDNFETEEGQKKLAEFAEKNNIGLITY